MADINDNTEGIECKDAAGVALSPYCEVRLNGSNDSGFIAKTSDVLESIEKPGNLTDNLTELSKKARKRTYMSEEERNQYRKTEKTESMSYTDGSVRYDRDPSIYLTFIPRTAKSNVNYSINSKLEPVMVIKEDDPENPRYYQRAQLAVAMERGGWKTKREGYDAESVKCEKLKIGENNVGKMEDLLLGLDPIVVRPTGGKRDVYLGDHLSRRTTNYSADGKMVIGFNRIHNIYPEESRNSVRSQSEIKRREAANEVAAASMER